MTRKFSTGDTLQQICDGVVEAAEADPDRAPEIYLHAAREFRLHAAGVGDPNVSAALLQRAAAFEAAASAALAVMDEGDRALAGDGGGDGDGDDGDADGCDDADGADGVGALLLSGLRDVSGGAATVDDFAEIEADHAQAHAEVGHLDDFEILARRNEIREARSAPGRSWIVPASVKDSTRLGGRALLKFAPTNQEVADQKVCDQQTVVLWQGRKDESRTWTADVHLLQVLNTAVGMNGRFYGEVQYGADFIVSPPVRFDIGYGTRLTGEGNYVSIMVVALHPGVAGLGVLTWTPATPYIVGDRRQNGGNPYVCIQAGVSGAAPGPTGNGTAIVDGTVVWSFASATAQVGASLGFFAAPAAGAAPVTCTLYADNLNNGSSVVFARPLRSVALLSPEESDPLGSFTITQLDAAGVDIGALPPLAVGSVVSPIYLRPDCAQIRLTNSGGAPASYALPFLLSL